MEIIGGNPDYIKYDVCFGNYFYIKFIWLY